MQFVYTILLHADPSASQTRASCRCWAAISVILLSASLRSMYRLLLFLLYAHPMLRNHRNTLMKDVNPMMGKSSSRA